MSEQPLRVLIVDDEESLRKPLAEYLHNTHGYEVDGVADGNEAMHLLDEAFGGYDVALVDQVLGEGPSGLEILRHIKSKYSTRCRL